MEEIITHHLEDIANNRLSAVARDTGMTVLQVQEAADVIRTLEPKPGRQFATGEETKYIIPDVIVEKTEDEYLVTINESSTPHLTISSYYRNCWDRRRRTSSWRIIFRRESTPAIWLIRSIEQRKQTIYNVVAAVVNYQRGVLRQGQQVPEDADAARILRRNWASTNPPFPDPSTANTCSVPGAYFELKYFFSAGVSDQVGEGVSSNSIKEFIKEIVEGEDPAKPYSDQAMVGILKEKGFNISRRTVAKYRDELGILSSSKRKRY